MIEDLSARTQRKAHALPAKEADLRAEYQALRAKREAETLTEVEHQQLIQLSNQIEQWGAQRLEVLATLAQLRQVALPTLIEDLGIQAPTYV